MFNLNVHYQKKAVLIGVLKGDCEFYTELSAERQQTKESIEKVLLQLLSFLPKGTELRKPS